MEYRILGRSGLRVSVLGFGTGTFGGTNEFFRAWGSTDVQAARRLLDICIDAGINWFDTADVYSAGASEEILGEAIKGRRDRVLVSTKATFRLGDGPNDVGSSRTHLVAACEASLRRLKTDHLDLYHMHGFDSYTGVEEVVRTLDDLVRAGKVRHVACSNFSGWQLMKSLAFADQHGLSRYTAQQAYYSLIGRDFEWELMPLGLDQQVATLVWSPLGWGRLTGKLKRNQPAPRDTRAAANQSSAPPVADELLFRVLDALEEVARESERTVPQVALAWLLERPTVAGLIVGARDEQQLRQNLGAVGWKLAPQQLARLEAASRVTPIYPYWHQRQFTDLTPIL